MSGGKQRPARSAIRRFKRSAYALATDLGNESPCGGRYRSTMARKPTQTLSIKVSISLLARARVCAKGMDLSLSQSSSGAASKGGSTRSRPAEGAEPSVRKAAEKVTLRRKVVGPGSEENGGLVQMLCEAYHRPRHPCLRRDESELNDRHSHRCKERAWG